MLRLRKKPKMYRAWAVVSAVWIAFIIFATLRSEGLTPFQQPHAVLMVATYSFLPPILTFAVYTIVLWIANITRIAWKKDQ